MSLASPVKEVEPFSEDEEVSLFVVEPHTSPLDVRSPCVPSRVECKNKEYIHTSHAKDTTRGTATLKTHESPSRMALYVCAH